MTNIPVLIQEHYDDPYHQGACARATHAAEGCCPESGCELRIELAIDEQGIVQEAWFLGNGCSCCEGLASLAMQYAEGRAAAEVSRICAANVPLAAVLLETAQPLDAICSTLPPQVLSLALRSPRNELEDDLTDASPFGGPSLREEC